MIEMICGAYGAKGRLIRPADGPFTLSSEEEKRLVERGVARYVQEAAAPPEPEREGEPAEPPQPETENPPKPKKPGRQKPEAILPDLTPEDPVE